MFFQTSAETVGITKNGRNNQDADYALAPHRLIKQDCEQEYAQHHGNDDQDAALR